MATLRRANCYRWQSPAFTRVSNNPADSFVTGIPGSKITKFDNGDPNGDWEVRVDLISLDQVQIRHNAIEAARQTTNRYLEKMLGKRGFHFKIRPYPHHIMRENKMATGAGADRVQDGMRKSYGKPVGRAARVREGQIIFSIGVPRDKIDIVKEALRRAKMKFSCSCRVGIVDLKPKEAKPKSEKPAESKPAGKPEKVETPKSEAPKPEEKPEEKPIEETPIEAPAEEALVEPIEAPVEQAPEPSEEQLTAAAQ